MVSDFNTLLPEDKLREAKKFIVFQIKEAQIKQNSNNPSVLLNRTFGSLSRIDPFWQQKAIDVLIEEGYIAINEAPWPVEVHLSETHTSGFLNYHVTVLESFDDLYQYFLKDSISERNNIIAVDYDRKRIVFNSHVYTYKRESNEIKVLFCLLRKPSSCVPSKELHNLLNMPRADSDEPLNSDRLRDVVKSIRNKFGKEIIESCSGGYVITHPIQVQD